MITRQIRWATASSCACLSSITPSRSPTAPPYSTSSRAGAWRWAPAARPPGPSSAASGRTPTEPRSPGTSSSAASRRCGLTRPTPTTASSVHARADHHSEGVPATASASVGRGHQSRHRVGRVGSGSRQPRAHVRSVRRAGETHRRVPPAHPALRSGGRLRERPGQHRQLIPHAPTPHSACCPSCAVRRRGPMPASRPARGWHSGGRNASCVRSRDGRRSAWTG
jgi:hypothetical protein